MFRRLPRVLLFPALCIVSLFMASGGGLQSRLLPPCLINEWTGLHCPGCGGTRAFQSLAKGDLMSALRMNSLGTIFIVALALLAFRISWEAAFPARPWPRVMIKDRWAWGIPLVLITFTLLRNLPWWPFNLLAPH